jgi:hypothetical protein
MTTKRKITQLEDIDKRPRSKNNLCDKNNKEYLGYCNLEVEDFYFILNINYLSEFNETFVLDVLEAANTSVLPVKAYVDRMHNNDVGEILTVIEQARLALTDETKKKLYDRILHEKYSETIANLKSDTSLIAANMMDQFKTILQHVHIEMEILMNRNENMIQYIYDMWRGSIDLQVKENFKPSRRTGSNRIQVKFKRNVKHYTVDNLKDQLVRDFQKFGTIDHVYIHPSYKSRAIVTFNTLSGMVSALEWSNPNYEIKEFSYTTFYDTRFFQSYQNKLNKLNEELQQLKIAYIQ